ATGQYAFGL
uniref:Carcinustatin-11 n=1 Tax=Carcinus maenas TaxID=6759 RepID=ALL11_CARMA|nr:RecName: Full=Carcinustatin-11 [Carcinus maenas]